MRDLMEQGERLLAGQQRRHASQRVTYARGSSSLCARATVGRTQFEDADASGVIVRTESRDFLIAAAELALDGIRSEPAVGDKIIDPSGTVFEVMPFAREPHWRWADGYRLRYRIHTKQVGAADDQ